jgi:hypothetical protein
MQSHGITLSFHREMADSSGELGGRTWLNFGQGEALAISVPVGETRVLKHFQARMPYSLFVPGAS